MLNTLNGESENRAVSPVIGVILMVAITVILAAVIGAFVLEIGDQQETAPSTSYDSEQRLVFYENTTSTNDAKSNLTTVEITHAGGEVNDISQTNIKVGGNGSIWGVETQQSTELDDAQPQPDQIETLGSNDAVEFSSGQSWEIIGGNNESTPSDDNLDSNIDYTFGYPPAYEGARLVNDATGSGTNGEWDTSDDEIWGTNRGSINVLDNGDTVNVVWTASSGGKTQNLFKYQVQ